MILGIILIIIGVVMLLGKLGILTGDTWDYVWPILIIILGASLIGRKHQKAINRAKHTAREQTKFQETASTSEK